MGNHVYYGRYLEMLESARGEFFRHLGVTFEEWQARECIFPVVECRLRYLAPARYDEVLTIDLGVLLARGPRLNFGYRVSNREKGLLVQADTLHVCCGLDEKPKRLPLELETALQPWLMKAMEPGG